MANKTTLRVEVVADGAAARTDLKQTETQVGQLEKQFGSLQSKLLGLASTASGLDLSKIGGIGAGVLGTAGEAAAGIGGGAGVAALVGPAAAATAGLGALVMVGKEATGSVITLAGETKKLARETGLSVETTSALLATFQRFGVDSEATSTALARFSRGLNGVEEAAQGVAMVGGKTTIQVLKELGVSATDTTGHLRPMNDVLLDVADKFKGMEDGPKKARLANLAGKGRVPGR